MKPIWWLQVDIWREEEGLLRAGTGHLAGEEKQNGDKAGKEQKCQLGN